jgi:adenine-specific DNA-methyltransferase
VGRPGKKAQRLDLDSGSLFDEPMSLVAAELPVLPDSFDAAHPEQSYCELVSLSHRKRFAQFFTPEPIAQLMTDWACQLSPKTLLDPSVGPGVFLRLASQKHATTDMVGMDVDPLVFAAAKAVLTGVQIKLIQHDFLTWADNAKFDAIVANPPYLRHHDIHYSFNIFAEIGRRNGIILSKLSNVYVLFVIEICRKLNSGGRAAIIIPGEWVNANFGMALKTHLLSRGYLNKLIYFSNLSNQFKDALTTAAILLIEKPENDEVGRDCFDSYFVENDVPIEVLNSVIKNDASEYSGVIRRKFLNSDLAGVEKWDKVLRDGMAVQYDGFMPLRSLAKSRRGIATGANEFFHLPDSEVKHLSLRSQNLKPCVGRAEHVVGLKFTVSDFKTLRDANNKAWLLSFNTAPDAQEQRYIQSGFEKKLHERFLLASRRPWYSMEQRTPSPIWAAVFGRTSLRFVYNEAGVSNLTTFHCLYPERDDPVFCKALVACLNSRLLQSMAEHQRRVYGGGLMKFEPKDLLSIQIPMLNKASECLIRELADMLDSMDSAIRREGQVPIDMMEVLDQMVRQAGFLPT